MFIEKAYPGLFGVTACVAILSCGSVNAQSGTLSEPLTAEAQLADTGLCERNRFGLPAHIFNKKFMWENDVGISDRDYTNGMKWERYLYQDCATSLGNLGVAMLLAHNAIPGVRNKPGRSNLGFSFGMNFYTPEKIDDPGLRAFDRPYSGWAYISLISVKQFIDGDRLTGTSRFEAMLGVLGDWAQQDIVQKRWHEWIDSTTPEGWHNQQSGAVGINFTHERQWFSYSSSERFQFSYGYGAALGNVRTEVKALVGVGYTTNSKSWALVDTAVITPSYVGAAKATDFTDTDISTLSDQQQEAVRANTEYDSLLTTLKAERFFTVSVRFEPRVKGYDYFLDVPPSTGFSTFKTEDWVSDTVVSLDFKLRRLPRTIFGIREIQRSREISTPEGSEHRFRQFMLRRYFE